MIQITDLYTFANCTTTQEQNVMTMIYNVIKDRVEADCNIPIDFIPDYLFLDLCMARYQLIGKEALTSQGVLSTSTGYKDFEDLYDKTIKNFKRTKNKLRFI
jgi:hypothetical protein